MKLIPTTLAFASILALAGCAQEGAESTGATAAQETTAAAPAEQAPALPEGFFLAEAPANALTVSQARANAKAGDDIALTGYIGGRVEPFTEGRAIFLVADSEVAPACTDACAVPWDACCVPRDTIAANSATIQVLDADGKTLKVDLKGQNGLEPGAEVTVVGKVREANESLLIVDASGIAANGGGSATP
ncbi:MAG: hypothetical protein RLY93_11225 [Sumerlaeia bacterium]